MAYSDKETAVIHDAMTANGEISYETAVEIADEIGKSVKSVIAKVKQLDLPYVPKPVPAAKPKGPTKAELVHDIEAHFGAKEGSMEGLTKATVAALENLISAF